MILTAITAITSIRRIDITCIGIHKLFYYPYIDHLEASFFLSFLDDA